MCIMRRLVYFSLILNLSSVVAYSSTYTNFTYVITETIYGAVRGMRVLQDDGKYLDVFAGIPFASPPIGDLRFAHPQPPLPWVGTIKDTFRFKAACPQQEWFLRNSFESFDNYDEDCLYLNIYAPHVPLEQNSYPVMLWIYGGAYRFGTAEQYDGSILAQKNVVVVTINYRIGALGWLSTDDDVAPGNYGLLDQIEAMKWVQDNIANFGGDPSRVTIFGESAGGGSVGLHLFSDVSRGLFHAAIPQSGCAASPWAIYRPPHNASDVTRQLAEQLDCPREPSQDLVNCLRTTPWDVFHDITVRGPDMISPWAPRIDGYFIKDTPENLLRSGRFTPVPMLIGTVKDEEAAVYRDQLMTKEKFDEELLGWVARFDYTGNSDAIFDAVEYEYTEPTNPNDQSMIRHQWIMIKSDYGYVAPSYRQAKYHSAQEKNTYMYSFQYRSRHNPLPEWMGVPHADELFYEFGCPFWGDNRTCPWGCHSTWYSYNGDQKEWSDEDLEMSDFFMTLVANFAIHSDPAHEPVNGIVWDEFNATGNAYLEINNQSEVRYHFRSREMHFWENYLDKVVQREPKVVEEPCPVSSSKFIKPMMTPMFLISIVLLVILSPMIL